MLAGLHGQDGPHGLAEGFPTPKASMPNRSYAVQPNNATPAAPLPAPHLLLYGQRSASPSELQPAELPCTDDGLHALLPMLEDGREASGAASAPPSSLGDRQQLTPARGRERAPAPLRRSARRQQQPQQQQQRANLPSPHALEVQRPSMLSPIARSQPPPVDSLAMSMALPAAVSVAAQAELLPVLEDQQCGALQQMFSAPASTTAPLAAELALVS